MKHAHDCKHHGHIWLEDGGILYVRHRGRKGVVHVHCQHCPVTADLESHAAFVPPSGPHTVDDQVPAPFKKVMDRALAEAQKATTGPAPMSAD